MKKLFILFCLFVSTALYSQEEYWLVDQDLMPYLKEYVKDSENAKYMKKSELISKIDYIFFNDELKSDENGELILGIAQRKQKGVLISSEIKDTPLLVKIVLYHEIGHLLKDSGKHTCSKCYDIMSSTLPDNPGPYVDERFLNLKIEEYFNWLKE